MVAEVGVLRKIQGMELIDNISTYVKKMRYIGDTLDLAKLRNFAKIQG